MTSASDEKWRPFNCFFQSREQVVVRRGQIRKIGWVIKILDAQVGVNFLQHLALQKKKLDDSSRLDVVEIARVA